ncbi:MAG: sigma-54-dependent Fis family transcriptional regulator [Gammaproteobacteria bacterium]|nr:sigma-54-dependent Fis family transcriptional regulator [Gammaproteobacteria bacterium]
MSSAYILVVDDEPDIRQLVQEILEDEGFEVGVAENAEAARQARRNRRPDLTLLDIWMPDTDGITLLKEWANTAGLDTPVIMMSGHGTVETAVEATRLGAYDFIEKPLSLAKLLLAVRHGLESSRLQQENIGLKRQVQPVSDPVGISPVIIELKEQIQRIAPHDTAVLIGGESGSGKQVFARYLHAHSPRQTGPFVDVAVMSGDESVFELFGSEDGDRIHFGWLEQANGGTLFLNDVAEMDPSIQTRFLSALQHQSFLRTGGKEPVNIDVRIIAATSRDLAAEVTAGRFREDLFYHLNVLPLQIPPLRKHHEDIPGLLDYYVNLLVSQDNLSYRRFNMAARNHLRNYAWPGNVRELINLVQRLLILGNTEEISQKEVEIALGSQPRTTIEEPVTGFDLPLREAREQFERTYLEYQLRKTEGNVSQVAQRVGMERTHLYRKLRALGLNPRKKS